MRYFRIFKIKAEERWAALVTLLFSVLLNGLVVWTYADKFMPVSHDHWQLFIRHFQVSGFDPITYAIITDWQTGYNVYRHPLLAFFVWPFYLLNQGLTALFGVNCVQFICAVLLIFCTVYSFVFLYRILREIIQLNRTDSTLLSALLFSFGYVMISLSVPDHFGPSMMLLICALYLSGKCMQKGRTLNILQTILLFFFTAGISLNNGIKIFLDAFFVNGKRFFRPKYLLLAVIVPALAMWGFARWEYKTFVWPKEMARKEIKEKKDKQQKAAAYKAFKDTVGIKDSATLEKAFKAEMKKRMWAKYRADHKKPWNQHTGKPIAKGEFSRWTDISTPRWDSMVENLFGESIQIHEDHLLGDTLRSRPVIIRYNYWLNYIVEALLVGLFLWGICEGRRERFLWMALAGFLFDMALHIGLGFGINEVYIMAAHWVFVIPIAIGYLFKKLEEQEHSAPLRIVRCLGVCLVLFLLIWNLALYVQFLLW
jgi:hypothetical protein